MPDSKAISRTDFPLTAQSLAEGLRSCGLKSGQTVMAHMAMSKLGWVVGGAEAVILALLDVLGPKGTLMMPTHTTSNTDPKEWQHPPVPSDWWQLIRDHTPTFQPQTTPTRGMGAVPELLRTWPGAIRSAHPVTSVAAVGPNAKFLVAEHPLKDEAGDGSPLGRLYELDGTILLLGVTHWNNTSLHLAEARAVFPGKRYHRTGSAILVDGRRQWVEYEVMETNGDDFGAIGEAFDAAHSVTVHHIADAEVRVFQQRVLVDYALAWMEQHRDLTR